MQAEIMSEPIKVGDLVMVIREHRCAARVGHIYLVTLISGRGFVCPRCHEQSPTGLHADIDAPNYFGTSAPVCLPVTWLKRIPPLSELEDEKNIEEMTV